jgi:cytochrome c-type biogenesis protein CcmH/NrfG
VALARKAVALKPTALNYYVLSNACDKSGDYQGALQAIEQAIQLEPGNAQYKQAYQRIKKNN